MTMNVFLSYASRDEPLRDELAAYLGNLRWQGVITDWHERNISLGKEWLKEIDPYLDAAQIILLLVSPNFVNSDYCYSLEMKHAIQRHETRQTCLIPVILRPVDWEDTPFAGFPALPACGKPITSWISLQEAFLDVARGIEAAARAPNLDPSSAYRQLSTAGQSAGSDKEPIWNVAYRRNPFFTGRENILTYLHNKPTANRAAASTQPQVISGIDGFGKTQIALEYAYRYRDDYEAVFWVNADSREILASDFARIAEILDLPEKDKQNQNIAVNAARHQLQTSAGWLLILDNVSDIEMVRNFFPTRGRGHILMVTRELVPRTFALNIEIHKMEPANEVLFLLKRAGIIAPDAPLAAASRAEHEKAREISLALHGLPLALDLAGAYIGEVQCSLAGYLNLYKQEKAKVLKQQGGSMPDYLEPVATTLAISLERVERVNPAAAELLRLCAFLHPDAIPEEMLTNAASELGSILRPVLTDWFEFNKTIRELRRYSLIQRNLSNSTLTLHRLLQAALRESMGQVMQDQWARQAVGVVKQAFPGVEPAVWQHCHRFLPHMLVCATSIEQWNMEFPDAARLLEQTGDCLQARVQYEPAEPLLRRALTIREKLLGLDHPNLPLFLSNLALFYEKQGKYAQAEPFYQRTLAIREKVLGSEHLDVAQCLNNLAVIYREQGKYILTEPLLQRALEIRKKALGPDHPDVATVLSNLATLYRLQGRYTQAEPFFQRALAIRERILGPDHPDVAKSCNALAGLYRAQGKYTQAEALYQRALAINERVLGPVHPDLATTLNNLALLYHNTGKHTLAEPLYQRALAIYEWLLGSEHPYVANCLSNLAMLYDGQGMYEQAEHLYQRALTICEKVPGPEHPYVAVSLNNLATFYTAQGKYIRAKPLFERALAIGERTLGPYHPDLAQFLENYATLLQKTKEMAKAFKLKARADAIRAQYAQEHPGIRGR
jgi:tetratricopeptide (TPR) repeat protein